MDEIRSKPPDQNNPPRMALKSTKTNALGCLLSVAGMVVLLAVVWFEIKKHTHLFGSLRVSHAVGFVGMALAVAGMLVVLWPGRKRG